jgi:hypothetical protein
MKDENTIASSAVPKHSVAYGINTMNGNKLFTESFIIAPIR